MSNATPLTLAALATALLVCGPAQAVGVSRAWVSGHGTDAAGCGAPSNPCRSLQYVHDNIIADGGEIDILDPAGYGAVAISKSVSIVNDGVGTAGVQATSGAAITINVAGATSTVTLRGLSVDGLGLATDGIDLSQVGRLTITNCVIRHFVHDAMFLQPTDLMTLAIVGTTAADNGRNGYNLSPSGNGQILGIVDHSYALNNGANGLVAWGANASGGIFVTASYDNFSGNGSAGVVTHGLAPTQTKVMTKDDVSDYNEIGYDAQTGSRIILNNSESILFFTDGADIESGGEIFSYGNNQIDGIAGGTPTPIAPE